MTITTTESRIVQIDGSPTECNPTLCAIEDCDTVVSEGTDPADLISVRNQVDADEALINAMGSTWVLKVAAGDDDIEYTDEAWELIGLPWCAAYNTAYGARAAELALVTRCQCGEWSGERCQWSGPESETVLVEFMPEEHRASHVAAGNRGVRPHNGARQIRVERSCAARMVREDGDWCAIVGGE